MQSGNMFWCHTDFLVSVLDHSLNLTKRTKLNSTESNRIEPNRPIYMQGLLRNSPDRVRRYQGRADDAIHDIICATNYQMVSKTQNKA